jgi:hypothetical protein
MRPLRFFAKEKEIPMPGGIREGAGRKAVPINLADLEKLCAMQCTDVELAAWFRVSLRTIQNRRKQPKFAEHMERGRAQGRMTVRRAQFRLLEAGNASIAIWMGKQVLGQRDTMQIAGADGGPVQTESKADFSRLSEDELRVLQAALEKAIGKRTP